MERMQDFRQTGYYVLNDKRYDMQSPPFWMSVGISYISSKPLVRMTRASSWMRIIAVRSILLIPELAAHTRLLRRHWMKADLKH